MTLVCRVECMVASSAGNVLVCGSASGVLTFRETWSLQTLFVISLEQHGSIKSLWLNDGTSLSSLYHTKLC